MSFRAFLAFTVLIACIVKADPPTGMYWAEAFPGGIWRAELDGSNPTLIVPNLEFPRPLTIDATTHKIYWGDINTNRIQRANLDGSNVETVVSGAVIDNALGLAVDPTTRDLYWTDFSLDKIARTSLVTFNTVTLLNKPGTIPSGIDLDLAAGQMYWANPGTNKIRRALLSGADDIDLLSGLNNPRDVTLDLEQSKMYWVTLFTGVWRSNLDGSDAVRLTIYSQEYLAFDRSTRQIYFPGGFGLERADEDGSNGELLLPWDQLVGGPYGIAVIRDCNENFIEDYDELSYNDCDGSRVPDDCEPDGDGDGVADACDNCLTTSNPSQGDCNADGIGDACEANADVQDADGDGACNGADGCPLDPLKTEPGVCGCGTVDVDSDADGAANCIDQCPGTPDMDSDGDDVLDCEDQCPGSADVDSDGDGILNCNDECPGIPDLDSDGDGVLDCDDQCPGAPEIDADGDTVFDCADVCPGEDDRIDLDANGEPDCAQAIPAMSQWGLAIFTLLLLIVAKTRFQPISQKQ